MTQKRKGPLQEAKQRKDPSYREVCTSHAGVEAYVGLHLRPHVLRLGVVIGDSEGAENSMVLSKGQALDLARYLIELANRLPGE